jgi:hypothetical protein
MLRKIIVLVMVVIGLQKANAQLLNSFVHQGELGFSMGAAH